MKKKTVFSNRLGFIMAAAGSAVGLGNLWRFPYLAAKYGGGTFLFIYLIIAVTFGFTLMITEIAIGRMTGMPAISAYRSLDKRFSFIGYIGALIPLLIFSYYCVVGGWVIRYLFAYLKGETSLVIQKNFFESFISLSGKPIRYLILFLILTTIIVALGVEKGVERFSRIFMPVLIFLTIAIALYVIFLPGAVNGVIYYLKPDFSKVSVKGIIAALGQLFYSMSLAMGVMITYGSYMKKEENIERAVTQIELFDTAIAFLSGLIIIPAVFAFSAGDPAVLNSGAGLMFITLPKIFSGVKMTSLLGGSFFFLVLFAALTSSVSLMETVISFIIEKTKMTRLKSCAAVFFLTLILALPASLSYSTLGQIKLLGLNIMDFFDFISNSILMPLTALFTCILVGYFLTPKLIIKEVEQSGAFRRKKLFIMMIKYAAPLFLVIILITSILNTFGIISL